MKTGDWVIHQGEKRQIIVEWDNYSVYLFGWPDLVNKLDLKIIH